MKLAVAQVAPVLGELQANLDRSRELIAQAVAEGAELIVFPELNLSGYLTRNQLALTANDPRLRAAIDAAGEPRHVHRKLILPSYHPFTEGQNFHPGNALCCYPRTAPTAGCPRSATASTGTPSPVATPDSPKAS